MDKERVRSKLRSMSLCYFRFLSFTWLGKSVTKLMATVARQLQASISKQLKGEKQEKGKKGKSKKKQHRKKKSSSSSDSSSTTTSSSSSSSSSSESSATQSDQDFIDNDSTSRSEASSSSESAVEIYPQMWSIDCGRDGQVNLLKRKLGVCELRNIIVYFCAFSGDLSSCRLGFITSQTTKISTSTSRLRHRPKRNFATSWRQNRTEGIVWKLMSTKSLFPPKFCSSPTSNGNAKYLVLLHSSRWISRVRVIRTLFDPIWLYSHSLAGRSKHFTWLLVPSESQYGRDEDLGDSESNVENLPENPEVIQVGFGKQAEATEKRNQEPRVQ